MKRVVWAGILLLLVFLVPKKTALAAQATVSLTTQNETVRVGDEFEVVLTIDAEAGEGESPDSAVIGDFEAFLIYDNDLFEFMSAPPGFSGDAGILKISDIGAEPSRNQRKYRIKFRAIVRGSAVFAFSTRPNVYVYWGDFDIMTVLSDSLTVTAEAAEDASDNANLSALNVSPGHLSPTFATTLREYEVSIPLSYDRIIISALTEDPDARVSVTGSTDLQVGRNKVVITVTAQNGTEKRYYLYVTREEQQAAPTGVPEQVWEKDTVDGFEAGIHAENEGEKIRLSMAGTYLVCEELSGYAAPTGYEETVLFVDGLRVQAYKRRDGDNDGFFVLILTNEEGESGYYRYDRTEQTIQRYDERNLEVRPIVQEDVSSFTETIRKYKDNQVILIFLLALFISFTIVLLIVVIRLWQTHHRDDEEDDSFYDS